MVLGLTFHPHALYLFIFVLLVTSCVDPHKYFFHIYVCDEFITLCWFYSSVFLLIAFLSCKEKHACNYDFSLLISTFTCWAKLFVTPFLADVTLVFFSYQLFIFNRILASAENDLVVSEYNLIFIFCGPFSSALAKNGLHAHLVLRYMRILVCLRPLEMKPVLKLRRNCLVLGIRWKVSWNLSVNGHDVFHLATMSAGSKFNWLSLLVIRV